jgi:archaemetzincin
VPNRVEQNRIEIVPVGPEVPIGLLDDLAAALATTFRISCRVNETATDVSESFDPTRGQYHATSILKRLRAVHESKTDARVIGITEWDLFVPILTFVFGEAELGGRMALVSLKRLDDRFYGLPHRRDMLLDRLVKEAVHELGHTYGLRHCPDWRCVMTSSHGVEKLDIKTAVFCNECAKHVNKVLPKKKSWW